MPFDFLVQLRASYMLAWAVCFAGLGRVITERPASVEQIPTLVVVSVAFATIATVTLLAIRIEWWRRLVLRDSASLDETKPGLSLLTALAYALTMYGAVYAFELWNRTELENSVNALEKVLDSEYEVKGKQFGNSATDLSGVWSVQSRGDLTEKLASKADFAQADEDDLGYFKQLVIDAFGSGEALDGYVLYRSERSLGEGTICNSAPCSIYVLVRPGSTLSYVGIYKT